jgi:transcriptional regulator with XRE-family HTH domain
MGWRHYRLASLRNHLAVAKVQTSMGNPRPQLLPQKLLIIREHLNLSQTVIKRFLDLSTTARISEYENAKREPSAMVTLGYSRLAQVPMASLVDDEISLNAFRKQLGTFDYKQPEKIRKKVVELKRARQKNRSSRTR